MYGNAKLAEQSCKSIRSHSWLSMLASTGLIIHIASNLLDAALLVTLFMDISEEYS
jgi:hypothetical protein